MNNFECLLLRLVFFNTLLKYYCQNREKHKLYSSKVFSFFIYLLCLVKFFKNINFFLCMIFVFLIQKKKFFLLNLSFVTHHKVTVYIIICACTLYIYIFLIGFESLAITTIIIHPNNKKKGKKNENKNFQIYLIYLMSEIFEKRKIFISLIM